MTITKLSLTASIEVIDPRRTIATNIIIRNQSGRL